MADSRNQKSLPTLAAELYDLVRSYAMQQTIEPMKGLGRYLAFGVAGSLMVGIGVIILALSLLRALQTETGGTFDGSWTWAPYLLTLVACGLVIGLAMVGMRRRSAR